MAQPKPIFVKLGGSLITEKTQEATPRPGVIRRLAGEVRDALGSSLNQPLVLGHGSGSFGHFAARRYHIHSGVRDPEGWLGMAETSAAAARLNRLVTDVFLEAGVPVISLQPSASAVCESGVLTRMAMDSVEAALAHGLVPLVYGDVSFDTEQGTAIVSTEDVFFYLASRITPSRILVAGEVDGIYEQDPLENPQSPRFPVITPSTLGQIRASLGGSHGTDVTGGMLGKVEKLLPLVQQHPDLTIRVFSGLIPGRLVDALLRPDVSFGTCLCAD